MTENNSRKTLRTRTREALTLLRETWSTADQYSQFENPDREFICTYFLEHRDDPSIVEMWDEFAAWAVLPDSEVTDREA